MNTNNISATSPRKVIIDTDPGRDDAITILLALAASDCIDLQAVTTVAGNVPLNLTQRNARIIRDWADRTASLPVYAGCDCPMIRDLVTASNVHGETGLEGVDLHEPNGPLEDKHAVSYLTDMLLNAAPHSISICAIGPLTNLGVALRDTPAIKQGIECIVLMGGAWLERGNVTPAAEFNMYVDPEAADIVFSSGVPIVVLPRDAAVTAPITEARVAGIRAIGNRCGQIVADLMQAELDFNRTRRGLTQAPLYDPLAIGYLIRPELFSGRKVNAVIEIQGKWTLGETVVDWHGKTGREPNVTWIDEVRAEEFYALFQQYIRALP